MKKSFKKQIILLAVLTVLMALAFVMPASAETPQCEGDNHLEIFYEEKIIPPTCEQYGYTVTVCSECGVEVNKVPTNQKAPTGHNFKAEYVLSEDGQSYVRVRTCMNDKCIRKGWDLVAKVEYTEDVKRVEKQTGYYLVEYVNKWESYEGTTYLKDYYVAGEPDTWVIDYEYAAESKPSKDGYYTTKAYTSGKEATLDHNAIAPAYEFVAADDSLKLYARGEESIPEYYGITPVRNKDLTYGGYYFNGWTYGAPENAKITASANFIPNENVTVSAAFYNYDGALCSTGIQQLPYGHTVNYGTLALPIRNNDQRNSYTLNGWLIDKNATHEPYGIKEDITVYHHARIYADFTSVPNQYTLKFVDFYGEPLNLADKIIECGGRFDNEISGLKFEDLKDIKYIYRHDTEKNIWEIRKVNGKELNKAVPVTVSARGFDLPYSVQVTENNQNKTIELKGGEELTIAPKYDNYVFTYDFKVIIKPARFLDEDVYEDKVTLKQNLLDKFIINVTDSNGKPVTYGQTNKDGEFVFSAPYSDYYVVTASMTNNKYYGDYKIILNYYETPEQIQTLGSEGVVILPEVTQEWLDGIKGCDCICHSILGRVVVGIYNIIYKIFGKEYVCCDDLFIVYGDLLSYGPKVK